MEMGNKALIITGNLVQDHEFIYPYYRLKEEGFNVTLALKDGKECLGILGTKIPSDKECEIISYEALLSEGFRYEDYRVLIIPGGAKCMEKLRQEKGVLEFIKRWNEKGKVIGSICHGAQLLISSFDLKDRKISGYYSIEDDIKNSGADYSREVVEDRNIVSSAHYKDLGKWMKTILKKL